jgi:hypothetical protein
MYESGMRSRHGRKRYDQHNVVQESQKGQIFRKGLECNNGIRVRGLRQQLRGSKKINDLGDKMAVMSKQRITMNGTTAWSSGQRSQLGSGGMLKKTLYEIFRGNTMEQVVKISSRL